MDHLRERSTASPFARIPHWQHRVEAEVEADIFRGGSWASWTIWSAASLPEAFWRPEGESLGPPVCALVYEVTLTVAEAALHVP